MTKLILLVNANTYINKCPLEIILVHVVITGRIYKDVSYQNFHFI